MGRSDHQWRKLKTTFIHSGWCKCSKVSGNSSRVWLWAAVWYLQSPDSLRSRGTVNLHLGIVVLYPLVEVRGRSLTGSWNAGWQLETGRAPQWPTTLCGPSVGWPYGVQSLPPLPLQAVSPRGSADSQGAPCKLHRQTPHLQSPFPSSLNLSAAQLDRVSGQGSGPWIAALVGA